MTRVKKETTEDLRIDLLWLADQLHMTATDLRLEANKIEYRDKRIEELEAALSHYACGCKEDKCTFEKPRYRDLKCGWPARQALGEKKNDASTGPTNTGYNTGWKSCGDWVD